MEGLVPVFAVPTASEDRRPITPIGMSCPVFDVLAMFMPKEVASQMQQMAAGRKVEPMLEEAAMLLHRLPQNTEMLPIMSITMGRL